MARPGELRGAAILFESDPEEWAAQQASLIDPRNEGTSPHVEAAMSAVHKLYLPANNWVVATLTAFCQARGIGNAEISGIGSITNIWVLLDPNSTPIVRNFSAGPSYEMTSLLGNVTLRQGIPLFDPSGLP